MPLRQLANNNNIKTKIIIKLYDTKSAQTPTTPTCMLETLPNVAMKVTLAIGIIPGLGLKFCAMPAVTKIGKRVSIDMFDPPIHQLFLDLELCPCAMTISFPVYVFP